MANKIPGTRLRVRAGGTRDQLPSPGLDLHQGAGAEHAVPVDLAAAERRARGAGQCALPRLDGRGKRNAGTRDGGGVVPQTDGRKNV